MAKSVEERVAAGWRLCTNSRHPHVWNVATTATGLYPEPKRIHLREFCPSHGGAPRPPLEQDVEPKQQLEKKMNNRDRILSYFDQRNNKMATIHEIAKGVDLVCGGRKKILVLRDILRRMKEDGYLTWQRSNKTRPSAYWMSSKGSSFLATAQPEQTPSPKPSDPFVTTRFFVTNEKNANNAFTDVREQKALESALTDWLARKTTGGKPRLFRVVELFPTLAAKL